MKSRKNEGSQLALDFLPLQDNIKSLADKVLQAGSTLDPKEKKKILAEVDALKIQLAKFKENMESALNNATEDLGETEDILLNKTIPWSPQKPLEHTPNPILSSSNSNVSDEGWEVYDFNQRVFSDSSNSKDSDSEKTVISTYRALNTFTPASSPADPMPGEIFDFDLDETPGFSSSSL